MPRRRSRSRLQSSGTRRGPSRRDCLGRQLGLRRHLDAGGYDKGVGGHDAPLPVWQDRCHEHFRAHGATGGGVPCGCQSLADCVGGGYDGAVGDAGEDDGVAELVDRGDEATVGGAVAAKYWAGRGEWSCHGYGLALGVGG